MAKLKDVCRHVRSKNAGPFWITVDLFFDGEASFKRYRNSPALNAEIFAATFGTDPTQVRRIPVDSLRMIKVSYPRPKPQGWAGERDMHGGQQFTRLLDIEVD